MGELIPMLFDIFTGALFAGGCLLLWLNLRRRASDAHLSPIETSVQIKDETADPKPEARHFKNTATPEPHQAIIAAPATSSSQSVSADTGDVGDQDSYAGRIALAM